MRHDVGTPLKWATVDGGGEGVVDDEWHAMLVGDVSKPLDIEHMTARIRDGFAEECFCIRTESLVDFLFRCIRVDEGALNTQFLQRHTKEVIGSAIDFVGGNEVVASATDIEDGVEVGSLSAGGKHCSNTAFQCCNLLGNSIIGGVLQTGVEVALFLQVEEVGHLLRVVVFECGTLINGQHACLTVLGFPTCLYTEGRFLQILLHIGCY